MHVVTPHTLVHTPGASGYGLQVQRASSRMPYPCALSIPYSTSLILCVHWNRLRNLEVLCTDARTLGWDVAYITQGNPSLGPVYQPPSSLARIMIQWARPMGCVATEVAALPPHRYTNLA